MFRTLMVLFALLSPSTQAAEPATIYPRTLLIVSDMEASKRFYGYALGLKLTRDAPIADAVTWKHLGIADTHAARIVVYDTAETLYGKPRESAVIALLQVSDPPLPRRPRAANLMAGDAVMALRTDDIDTVIARLKEIGAIFAVEPVRTPDGLIEMAVLDPDGVRMQINQRPDRE
ncbi:MAG: VOC family protein [Rhodospirillaceae bacterium]|nr:VOC family protein [Rhodospirillaceae bacterium]